jgi:RHS repeat-associated protein
MTSDLNRSLTLEYALGTNLPERIIHPGGHIRNYYTPAGRKTGKKVFDASNNLLSQELYFGDLIIKDGCATRILHGDGVVNLSGGPPQFDYHIKDHLGNVRLVITPDASNNPVVLQANDYYPFGMSYSTAPGVNKYLYNSKEEQEMPGKFLDYGWRMYDAQLGRWHGVDPLAEAFSSFTPYHYVRNNPIKLFDPNGMADNEWFERQQAWDEEHNAQHDAMFSTIMTNDGSSNGNTKANSNTGKEKQTDDGEKEDVASSGRGNPVKIVGGMASFDMTLATPGGGVTFEMGEINIEGQDYMFISVGPSYGVELSISLINVGVMVAQPSKISVQNDFAGKGASYTGNASVFSLNISSARQGEQLEKYAIIKGGVGVGFGGSMSMTTTWVWKVPDLYKGTEFEGFPYGPVP